MQQQHGLSGATFVVRQHDVTLTESQGVELEEFLGPLEALVNPDQ